MRNNQPIKEDSPFYQSDRGIVLLKTGEGKRGMHALMLTPYRDMKVGTHKKCWSPCKQISVSDATEIIKKSFENENQ